MHSIFGSSLLVSTAFRPSPTPELKTITSQLLPLLALDRASIPNSIVPEGGANRQQLTGIIYVS